MKALGLALALLLTPVAVDAMSITSASIGSVCAPMVAGMPVDRVSHHCAAETLYVFAKVGPFPVAEPVSILFTLSLDDVLVGADLVTLPADLGPVRGSEHGLVTCQGCVTGADGLPHYTAAGVGWMLPLDVDCCRGRQVSVLVTATLFGQEAQALDFTVLEPVPEPATLLLLGSTLVAAGVVARKRGRR